MQRPRGERSGCIDSSGCAELWWKGVEGLKRELFVSTTTGSAVVNGVATFHFSVVLPPFEFPLSITAINRRLKGN